MRKLVWRVKFVADFGDRAATENRDYPESKETVGLFQKHCNRLD